jgi:hypothetical protein
MYKRRILSCQIETEPAQRARGHNQVREAEKGKNKEAPVVEKGLKAEVEAARDPVAAEAWAAARGQANKIPRINNTNRLP